MDQGGESAATVLRERGRGEAIDKARDGDGGGGVATRDVAESAGKIVHLAAMDGAAGGEGGGRRDMMGAGANGKGGRKKRDGGRVMLVFSYCAGCCVCVCVDMYSRADRDVVCVKGRRLKRWVVQRGNWERAEVIAVYEWR